MAKFNFTLFAIVFFSTFAYLNASQVHTPRFLHVNIEDGLSNGGVTSLLQDSIGFIWIGTKHGLNRYDGYQFKLYARDRNNLKGNDISVLYQDSKSHFWVGTIGEGLCLYDALQDSFKSVPLFVKGFKATEIHALVEDKNGILWIGTELGLYSYNPANGKINLFRQKGTQINVSAKNDIRAIALTPDGTIWLGTYGAGLYMFDMKQGAFVPNVFNSFDWISISSDYINTLFYNKKGQLLVGANGLKLIDLKSKRITNYLAKTPYDESTIVRSIWEDKKGNLWIGTDGIGVLYIEHPWESKPRIFNYRNKENSSSSLSSNTISIFFEDRQANLWIGTAKHGVSIIKREPDGIEYYYTDGMGFNRLPVLSVFNDKRGLWMGTDGEGISLLNPQSGEVKRYYKSFSKPYIGDFIQCIKPSVNGDKLWVGTYAQGLFLFDPLTSELVNFKRGLNSKCVLPHNDVRDVIELPGGELWIATWGGGLVYYNPNTSKTEIYQHEPDNPGSLSSNNVLSLYLDSKHRLWIATYGGGVAMLDINSKKFTNFRAEDKKGLSNNYIFTLLPDNDQAVWVGTTEGLFRLNLCNYRFEAIPIDTDYPGKTILSLTKDKEGNLWAGTKKGILRVLKGSQKAEFLPDIYDNFYINSVYADQMGKLYFGGGERVVAFNPSRIQFNTRKAPVCITDFLLFNKQVPIGPKSVLSKQIVFQKKITLNYRQSVITISYSTLNFPNSKSTNYEVKLEGMEDKWRYVGTQNSATFTNLSPGKYTFMVRPVGELMSSMDTETARIEIEVLPPNWRTWWAYLLYILLFIVFFYLYRRYTVKWVGIRNELKFEKLKREQDERIHQLKQRFFINISHDIRTPLTLIAGSVNKLLERTTTELSERKKMMIIRTNINRLLNLTDELLNFRKLETGYVRLQISEQNIVEFVEEIFMSYTQFAINKNIEYNFEASLPEIMVWIDKVQLEKAICNLISNAFKFTCDNGIILIRVNYKTETGVIISVSDNGIGIPAQKKEHIFDRFYQAERNGETDGFGIGLSIVREIVQLHGGSIQITSEQGKGSVFSIILKEGKEHLKNVDIIESSLNNNPLSEHFEHDHQEDFPHISQDNSLKEYSILVVEDNQDIRAYLSELISTRYDVLNASNGQEALEKSIELMPDLIISDVMMPVMDGFTFCRKLKSDMRVSHIPVILLTARVLVDSIIEGFETGADEYLTKPFNERILLIRIENLLRSRREIRKKISQELILNPHNISLNSQDEIFLSKLVSYIEENIQETELNIGQLSNELNMSHSNLYKKVKALTGMTVIGFIKDFRLKRAAQLLSQNAMYISEIAYQVGYSERRHFSMDFKRKFNLTPREYVEKHANNSDNE